MKKDRNCGCQGVPYPIYPNQNTMFNQPMQGVMPIQNIPMQGMYDQNILTQINNLEKRVTNLENLLNNNSYNNSNFQMM